MNFKNIVFAVGLGLIVSMPLQLDAKKKKGNERPFNSTIKTPVEQLVLTRNVHATFKSTGAQHISVKCTKNANDVRISTSNMMLGINSKTDNPVYVEISGPVVSNLIVTTDAHLTMANITTSKPVQIVATTDAMISIDKVDAPSLSVSATTDANVNLGRVLVTDFSIAATTDAHATVRNFDVTNFSGVTTTDAKIDVSGRSQNSTLMSTSDSKINANLQTEYVSVNATTESDINLSGSAVKADFNVASSANINAPKFEYTAGTLIRGSDGRLNSPRADRLTQVSRNNTLPENLRYNTIIYTDIEDSLPETTIVVSPDSQY